MADVLAESGGAALEYVVTARDVWLFTLTRGRASSPAQLAVQRLAITPEELDALVDRLSGQLAARDLQFKTTATRLFDALVRPARQTLAGGSLLVIVPDGPLWQVPFQALWDSTGSEDLIESHAVAYAPSLTFLSETRRRHEAGKHLGEQSRGEPGADVARLGKSLAGCGGRCVVAGFDAARRWRRCPRPSAKSTLSGGSTGRRGAGVYTGRDAREDCVKAEAGGYSILHIATHGILDNASPMYSHVLLAPSADPAGDDGVLQAWEIARLQLGADLVVLSGCETARGRIAPGEGVIGLTWSLFVAGASTAVVSQLVGRLDVDLGPDAGLSPGVRARERRRAPCVRSLPARCSRRRFHCSGALLIQASVLLGGVRRRRRRIGAPDPSARGGTLTWFGWDRAASGREFPTGEAGPTRAKRGSHRERERAVPPLSATKGTQLLGKRGDGRRRRVHRSKRFQLALSGVE